jgi:hypothetical protein
MSLQDIGCSTFVGPNGPISSAFGGGISFFRGGILQLVIAFGARPTFGGGGTPQTPRAYNSAN